jgi:transposase
MDKREHGRLWRGSPADQEVGISMRYVGIDVGSDSHVVAAVTADGTVAFKPTGITEDAAGYAKLFALLGQAPVALVTMEATGHYWRNLFAALAAHGYAVALINPLRTRRFAGEDLARTKTDSIDALGIARFGAQKCPAVTRLPDAATDELRELVRHRDRLVADFGDRVRQLHRLVDLGFPEFTRHVKSLDSMLACTLLAEYPNAQAFAGAAPRRLAKLVYDGVHKVGPELAAALIAAAKVSVGHHHGPAYRIQVRHTCQDLDLLRRRIRELDGDITRQLDDYEVGSLLTSIEGIGTNTAARLIAELGDLGRFRNAAALAAYIGVVPGLKQSGKRRGQRAGLCPIGHARLRAALWMPLLAAVRRNPWLKAFYDRLISRGKLPKVALVAALRKLLGAVFAVVRDRKPFVPRLGPAAA